MISEKDRTIVKHLRLMFSKKDSLPVYDEECNAFMVVIRGSYDVHKFAVSCVGDVLSIGTVKTITSRNASIEFLKYISEYISEIHLGIPMGGFCYSAVKGCLYYKLGVPAEGNTSKESFMSLLSYACDVLDHFVPDILANASNRVNGQCNNRTFH